jgi:hypothetical protein
LMAADAVGVVVLALCPRQVRRAGGRRRQPGVLLAPNRRYADRVSVLRRPGP